MLINYVKSISDRQIQNEIFEMLKLCDDEFVPPLSSRSSTTQSDLSGRCEKKEFPKEYFDKLVNQSAFIADEDGVTMGFMSFKENYVSDAVTETTFPNVYISTIIVHPQARGKGITKKFYAALMEKYADRSIFTRTWSTNASHMRILNSLGFCEFKRIKNDRGNGIDTVYYRYNKV